MEAKPTTDEQKVSLKWKTVIPVVVAMMLGSNAFTAYKYQIDENKQDVIYNSERSDRKDKAVIVETKQLIYISELETEIKRLKRHQCND